MAKRPKIDTSKLTVDTGININEYKHTPFGNTRPRTGPFWAMKVGESVFVPDIDTTTATKLVSYVRKINKWKFSSREDMIKGVKGRRIWRTE